MRGPRRFVRGGTRLALHDLGGVGPPMLHLHGLAGHAGEWDRSAELLAAHYRVFALDQRGHGESERHPADLTRAAFVADCAEAIRQLGLGPVVLVGQSMGASTALLTAAAHPELVRSLVVIEGSPDGPAVPDPTPAIADAIRAALSAWPAPFADAQAARSFFRSKGFDEQAWTAGLERRPDGLWPRWDLEAMVACMADLGSRGYWSQWRAIRCPTLVLVGEHGIFPAGHGDELAAELPAGSAATIPGAGHDLHLDAPAAWVAALRASPAR